MCMRIYYQARIGNPGLKVPLRIKHITLSMHVKVVCASRSGNAGHALFALERASENVLCRVYMAGTCRGGGLGGAHDGNVQVK